MVDATKRPETAGRPIKPLTWLIVQKVGVEAPTPPLVDDTMPIERRMAAVIIILWDTGEEASATGVFLETLGLVLAPAVGGSAYPVKWLLQGKAGHRGYVTQAIDTLAKRGYVIDAFAACHGLGEHGEPAAEVKHG